MVFRDISVTLLVFKVIEIFNFAILVIFDWILKIILFCSKLYGTWLQESHLKKCSSVCLLGIHVCVWRRERERGNVCVCVFVISWRQRNKNILFLVLMCHKWSYVKHNNHSISSLDLANPKEIQHFCNSGNEQAYKFAFSYNNTLTRICNESWNNKQ